jgi:hypothetical protein
MTIPDEMPEMLEPASRRPEADAETIVYVLGYPVVVTCPLMAGHFS